MKNIREWKPTTFIYNDKENLIVNEKYVNDSSLFVATQAAKIYHKKIKKYSSGILLDLGCGTVPYYNVYKDQVKKVICIDWENSYHKKIHLDYIADLNDKIPLEDNCVDTILLMDVLEHICKPQKLMTEISRVLRPNGKLILGVPFLYQLHEEPFDFHRYTQHQLRLFCKENNLKVLNLEEIGGPLSVILDIIGKNIPSKLFPKTFQKFAIFLSETKIGNKIDNRNKKRFPRSYCLVAQKIDIL